MKRIRYVTIWTILILCCLLIGVAADTSEAGLKSELADGNTRIAELEEKLKQLEEELKSMKRMSKLELQELVNDKCGEYEGVICRAIISGNEDEIRLKLELDLSRDRTSWNRLNFNKRKEMLKRICDLISSEYEHAKIKGYVKDISISKKILTFYITNEGAVEIGTYRNYSVISTLEDRFNNEYDNYFNGIHLTYALNGNDSRLQYMIYVQKSRFEEQWNNKKEPTLKNFMKKLCSEVGKEFSDCNITGVIYDTDGSRQLAKCEQNSDGAFSFSMEP